MTFLSFAQLRCISKGVCCMYETITLNHHNDKILGALRKTFLFENNRTLTSVTTYRKYSTLQKYLPKSGIYGTVLIDSKHCSAINEDADCMIKHQILVESLCDTVGCSEEAASDLIVKYPFLKKTKMTTLKMKLDGLLELGLTKEQLLNDMWIFTYSLPKLKEKLQFVEDMKVFPIKPWHLRCSIDILIRLSENKEIDRLAMSPHESKNEYICERLGITESQVLSFYKRHPPVMRVKVSKLKTVINFLFKEGFSSHQIYSTPRILCHSLKTTQRRLEILRANNKAPYSLFILCKSQRQFNEYIKNLSSAEKKKDL